MQPAVGNLPIEAANATNPRIDLVCAVVRDAQYSGGENLATLLVVTGTPAGSPVPPTPPNNCVVLAQVAVAAKVTKIETANITDERPHASDLSVGNGQKYVNKPVSKAEAEAGVEFSASRAVQILIGSSVESGSWEVGGVALPGSFVSSSGIIVPAGQKLKGKQSTASVSYYLLLL